ncbi:MAG: flagellar export chaperone FliS [Fimbriimonadaceae bacterium]
MSYSNASIHQYRKSSVDSASPLKLVVMLYDGALRFLNQAKVAMQQKDYERQNDQCKRAQDIISELMSCLDRERGGEIAESLMSLYVFTYDRIVQANIEDNELFIDQAMKVLGDLRESWAELEKTTTGEQIGYAQAS